MTEDEIRQRALQLIEEIASDECDGEDTKEGRALGRIYMLAHYANAPHCRVNHPSFGAGIASDSADEKEASKP